ncbi:N(G),N(G)-dimethylarginine dimethylaminohydrolase 1 isoform X1 [Toxorhynchites rutilus septentrionalis]|uniref:N(G),N(G)-dimethylarginine dimethylaminohydrolase 1 isoform X1 n=1 Tax=Toxorhynchites rutilus septentrionalis TaxID=329112 RepID=UPI00247A615E|nr:N(G),N(G)-dimethylarginine dimethylaminohydrolase 1 isoform X1 [Toxorhynchites rutilus septentrionalis]XP_055617105.1 N(G),N(G)-dimethylarginine dimethylaminohydrolase 1 isoform X1 [Toxorhynchites rutilus septentrionalis]XP_055617106.1 N(G),N(G)-dimethylarginine dimethylaminohydrolase 1 isoform X1 [Toxorhynchites rutilus septentrionalis]
MASQFRYTHAITCRIPLSLRTRGEIDLEEAKLQHEAYVRQLRDLGLDVIELPPDENLPECPFVEDCAVVCNGIALICRPGDPNRLKEVDAVRCMLRKELDLPLAEIADQNARLDGGDVLFTGREFFVGLSKWTNEAGARAVAAAFPEYPCAPIKVEEVNIPASAITLDLIDGIIQVTEHHHLKYYVSMAGTDVLCVSKSKESQEILKRIEREATYPYTTLTLQEEQAANVLYINGTLIHRSVEEIPQSAAILSQKLDIPRQIVPMTELGKFSNGLSACCVLVKRSRRIKSL